MSRDDYRRHLRAISGGGGDPPQLQSRPPQWLIDRVLEACRGQPDAMLMAWLATRQVFADDVEAWQHQHHPASRDWANPGNVMRAAASLDGHPMRAHLGGMLGGLVQRHAPQNLQYLPPEFAIPYQERP